MATHALATTGTGGTAAASVTLIGANLTLPAGGPWNIFGVWGQAVQDTAVASEAVAGQILFQSISGDISPDPAPGRYPLTGIGSGEGANIGISACPLNIWEVDWSASGKATVSMSFVNDAGNATAPVCAMGIIFGDERPVRRPLKFCDAVSATLTAAAETSIGTITLAEKATRIVGIYAYLIKDGAVTADEAMIGTIRLDSADMQIPPAQYPFAFAYSAADGTPAGQTPLPQSQFIPVDIPVIGGMRVNCFGTLVNAVTAGCEAQVFIAYE